ncbi:MAG: L,D-transpeptidase family protein, partial [Candidatus Latescibacterota bacterium]
MSCRTALTRVVILVLVMGHLSGEASRADTSSASEVIQSKMDLLASQGSLAIGDEQIRASQALPMFYERRGFERVWAVPGRFTELRRMIAASADDGFVPDDYHTAVIDEITGSGDYESNPERIADLDILCTDAFLTLAYHVRYGKVDPERLDADWNIYDDIVEVTEMVESMEDVFDVGSTDIFEAIKDLRPSYKIYTVLSKALVEYRTIEEEGGWPTIPDGDVLKQDVSDPRVLILRERLEITDDLEVENPDDSLFDEDVAKGIERFQKRHGLDADGVVGKNTLAALNIPVAEKIGQIRVNLERLRWVLHDESVTFVVVNIAGFEVFYARDEKLVWRSRVQVGKEYRKTPVFRADMKYLVFNPTWTVPPTILKKDMIPKTAKDPSYLDKKIIKVIDNKGQIIPAASVDWTKYLNG